MSKRQYTRYDPSNLTAKFLLEIGAVKFRPDLPYKFTSGRLSPMYVDIRRVCGVSNARNNIISMACHVVYNHIKSTSFRVVAGGETAGIPFAALIADRLDKPMAYIRKQPKAFGRGAQIEGMSDEELELGQRFLLCEDLITDGGSKQVFIDAIRKSGNIVISCFCIYSYGCFGAAERLDREGVKLYSLCDAAALADVAEDLELYPAPTIQGVRDFIADPDGYWDAHKEKAA
jgi:orotate phosphoribosyltransferase